MKAVEVPERVLYGQDLDLRDLFGYSVKKISKGPSGDKEIRKVNLET